MHGPVVLVQTTSQLNLVFSVMTSVAAMTPHTVLDALATSRSVPPLKRAVVEPVGGVGRESVQLEPESSTSAQANTREALHVPVCIPSPCRREATIALPGTPVNAHRRGCLASTETNGAAPCATPRFAGA